MAIGNDCFRQIPKRKRIFPVWLITVFASGNDHFRLILLKVLCYKALRAVFSSYNIIIIEREYYYNSPFLNFEENRRIGNKLRFLTYRSVPDRSPEKKKIRRKRKFAGEIAKTGTLLCLSVTSFKKSKQNVLRLEYLSARDR